MPQLIDNKIKLWQGWYWGDDNNDDDGVNNAEFDEPKKGDDCYKGDESYSCLFVYIYFWVFLCSWVYITHAYIHTRMCVRSYKHVYVYVYWIKMTHIIDIIEITNTTHKIHHSSLSNVYLCFLPYPSNEDAANERKFCFSFFFLFHYLNR